ncbi:hypothetical protein ACLX1H_005665 [Fusarium chlamydosporum]
MSFNNLPRIFLLSARLHPEELHELEERIPTLTYDINEAEIVVGKISQPKRAEFELRRAKLDFAPVEQLQTRKDESLSTTLAKDPNDGPSPKRRRVSGHVAAGHDTVKVVKLAWLLDSWEKKKLLPMDQYVIYQVIKVSARGTTSVPVPADVLESEPESTHALSASSTSPASSILERALAEQKMQPTGKVARLPGCGDRIAELWHHWKDTGESVEVREANADPKISVLKVFYNIWGVGAVTARDFYQKGWRDLDDLVEHGWNTLSRSQQIGVKYYNEFLLGIPQDEVVSISTTILKHTRIIDPGFEMVIVGGYRRGKQKSGDVDVVLSHRDESKTFNVIPKIVVNLEQAHLITHTLTLSTHNSERGQRPVSWKGQNSSSSGFDTLDKALVVWKDPSQEDAPHRRVDIIISPWKT